MKALSDFIAIILFFATYTATKNIILATTVAVVTGVAQAAYTYWQHSKLEPTQWLSFILVVVFGGLTIAQNSLRLLLGKELTLPDHVWHKLGYAWIGFFLFLGALNLAIAYPFTAEREPVWMNFKLWGYLPISIAFSIAQGIYLVKHLPKESE